MSQQNNLHRCVSRTWPRYVVIKTLAPEQFKIIFSKMWIVQGIMFYIYAGLLSLIPEGKAIYSYCMIMDLQRFDRFLDRFKQKKTETISKHK